MAKKIATISNGEVSQDVIEGATIDSFGANGKALVFKDNNSEDKYVVFGVGATLETEGEFAGQVSPSVIEYVRNEMAPGIEKNFNFTLTDELYEFKENDAWRADKSAPSQQLLNAIFGVDDEAMKIS
jgi:hypothetical protein